MKVAVQHTAAIIRDGGGKFTDKEGKEISAMDNLSQLRISYDQLKSILISIYDDISTKWASSPSNRNKSALPAFNQLTEEYATCIEDCWKSCWDCGLMGVTVHEEHNCKSKGSDKYCPMNKNCVFKHTSVLPM